MGTLSSEAAVFVGELARIGELRWIGELARGCGHFKNEQMFQQNDCTRGANSPIIKRNTAVVRSAGCSLSRHMFSWLQNKKVVLRAAASSTGNAT